MYDEMRRANNVFQAISNALTQCPKSYLLAQLEEQKRCLCRRPLCNCPSPSSTLLCNISLLSRWCNTSLLSSCATVPLLLSHSSTNKTEIQKYLVFISSVRSSNSHPDLLVIHQPTPLFQITPVLNTGLSLFEPLQLSKAITGLICWLHVYLMGTTGHHCKIVQDSAR